MRQGARIDILLVDDALPIATDAAGNASQAATQVLAIDLSDPVDPNPQAQEPITVPVVTGTVPVAGPQAEGFVGSENSVDMLKFTGAREDFTVVKNAEGGFTVTRSGAPDSIASIERLQFDDGILALDVDAAPGEAFRQYLAAFSRDPD